MVGPVLFHDLVDEALDDGGHLAPPDRADDNDARGPLDELLVVAHQRVQRAALREQGQLLSGHARVEAVGVEVDDVVGPARLVQGGGGGLEHGVVEGAVVGVGVDDESALARLLGSLLSGHQLSPIVTMARRAARMKVVSAVVVLSVAIRGHRCPRLSGRRAALGATNVRRVTESSLACRGTFCVCGDTFFQLGASRAPGDGIAVPDGVECPWPQRDAPGRAECPRPCRWRSGNRWAGAVGWGVAGYMDSWGAAGFGEEAEVGPCCAHLARAVNDE